MNTQTGGARGTTGRAERSGRTTGNGSTGTVDDPGERPDTAPESAPGTPVPAAGATFGGEHPEHPEQVVRRPTARTPGAAGGLLVVGDVVTDIVARHRGPLARGTDTAATVETLPGGAGANVACWAAHWGCPDVRLLGRVGAESADWHRRALVTAGVRAELVVDPQAPTGTVICMVDTAAGAERTFLTDSGASLQLSPADWSPSVLDGVARLHLSGYLLFSVSGRALVREAVASARKHAVPVSLDPASAGFLRELGVSRFLALVDGVTVLLPSRTEARLLTGLTHDADAAARLSRMFPLVVTKQGADGALVARDGTVQARLPAVPAQPRDSTGAGDAFTGAFLAALLAGADPERAAGEGCRAGALAVAQTGGRPPAGAAGAERPDPTDDRTADSRG